MKANTTKLYPYVGDYYGYDITYSADGSISQKDYWPEPIKIKMALSINLLGELVIDCEKRLQQDGFVAGIIDANGTYLYEGGEYHGRWQITQTAPILGPNGILNGYRFRAPLIDGASD
jgi:hypothetical protein